MLPFNEYITGNSDTVARRELDRLAERYEWFTTVRRAKNLLTGEDDPALALPLMFWPTILPAEGRRTRPASSHAMPAVRPETVSAEDALIGKFLEHGGYRIVPDEDSNVADALTSETFDDSDGELLTEELAEIYRSQGLMAEAKEIYRRLSLLNPEKSIYFADVIDKIDTETTHN